MLEFQRYQLAFSAHIRNPKTNQKPALVDDTRMAVYRENVFDNILSSVTSCFPVCLQVLGQQTWENVVRDFFAKHQVTSPLFREIPRHFLQFLKSVEIFPAYIYQLAHYEWVELAVNTQDRAATLSNLDKASKTTDLMDEKPMLAPAHRLLAYDYAVHKISPLNKPKETEKTYLLVFRNSEFSVKFIELNIATYQLLNLIKENNMTGRQALIKLAQIINHVDTQAVIEFGAEILNDLMRQEAIIGSKPT